MIDWIKVHRIKHGFYIIDEIAGAPVRDADLYNVRFPSGTTLQLPAMVRRLVLMTDKPPYVEIRDQVFFSVAHEGLPDVWVRGLDVDVQPV